jgi:hypothetical protein
LNSVDRPETLNVVVDRLVIIPLAADIVWAPRVFVIVALEIVASPQTFRVVTVSVPETFAFVEESVIIVPLVANNEPALIV